MEGAEAPEALLTKFGFTELESRLYVQLMRHASATGYRLAQLIGKAPANTYQGLAGLMRKGAVISDEAEPKTYRAIAPTELFARLRQSFDTSAQRAVAALSAMHAPVEEDRLYRLRTVPQALQRARTLIESARQILLFDLFPEPLAALHDALMEAARRGITVAGLVYQQPCDAPYIQVLADSAGSLAERWPGQQLSLIGDAQEVLVAMVARGGGDLLQGLWSDSPYLACIHHSGLSAEIRVSARRDTDTGLLRQLSLLQARPPGLHRLIDDESTR